MPINIADKPLKRTFNSSPLEFKGTGIDSLTQKSYNSYIVHCNGSAECLMKNLHNSNPVLNFHILGNEAYDNEESELINRPDKDIWAIEDIGNGNYSIHLN
jgi:hypothetical protein